MQNMIKITKQSNQSILDISLQCCGTVEALFDLLKLNNLDQIKLQPIMELYIPDVQRPQMEKHYRERSLEVASIDSTYYRVHNQSFNQSFN